MWPRDLLNPEQAPGQTAPTPAAVQREAQRGQEALAGIHWVGAREDDRLIEKPGEDYFGVPLLQTKITVGQVKMNTYILRHNEKSPAS